MNQSINQSIKFWLFCFIREKCGVCYSDLGWLVGWLVGGWHRMVMKKVMVRAGRLELVGTRVVAGGRGWAEKNPSV